MDIQARKIHFVQEFLRLKNEELIIKLEKLLRKEKQKNYERKLEPMSIEELEQIIDKSEDDSKNGRIITATDLKNEIDSWS